MLLGPQGLVEVAYRRGGQDAFLIILKSLSVFAFACLEQVSMGI